VQVGPPGCGKIAGWPTKKACPQTERTLHDALLPQSTDELAKTTAHGLQTSRILLHASAVSEGYTALWQRWRLDLTGEALIHEVASPLYVRGPRRLYEAAKGLSIPEGLDRPNSLTVT